MQAVAEPDRTAIESRDDARRPSLFVRCVAECFGTFLMVFLGVGAVHAAVLAGAQSGIWQVAVVWAIAVALAIHATAAISGAHINPAMTIAFSAFDGFPRREVVPYCGAQLLGAFVAAAALHLLFADFRSAFEAQHAITRGAIESLRTAQCYGEYFPNPGAPDWLAISLRNAAFAEGLGTAVLAFVVFSLTDRRNASAPESGGVPLRIGLTVAALISVIAPLTQAGFNPARDFGPRLFAWLAGWGDVAIPGPRGGWLSVYILSPIVGALVGAAAQRALSHAARVRMTSNHGNEKSHSR